MILSAAFYGLKLYIYNTINARLQHKIEFKNLDFGVFPLRIQVRDLKELVIKDKNIISFKEVTAEMPFFSFFSKIKTIDISIHQPVVRFDKSLLKKSKTAKTPSLGAFKIRRVNLVDGKLIYSSPMFYATLEKFNLKSFPKENDTIYRLWSPHMKVVFPMSVVSLRHLIALSQTMPHNVFFPVREITVFEGQMLAEFREHLNSYRIGKFYWETEQLKINANGRVYKDGKLALNLYARGSLRQILDPVLFGLSIREYMTADARIKKTKDGPFMVDGDLSFNHFSIKGEPFKDMKGTIGWDSKSKRLRIDTRFRDEIYSGSRLNLEKGKNGFLLTASNLSAEKVSKIVGIDGSVPMGGLMEQLTLEIRGREFKGSAFFAQDPENFKPNRFNSAGKVDFTYNSGEKSVLFSSDNLQTEFGHLAEVTGAVTPRAEKAMDIKIKGFVDEAGELEKYTLFYINLPLSMWRLQKGRSTIDIHVKEINNTIYTDGNIQLKEFYSGPERINSLTGRVTGKGGFARGQLVFDDPSLTGRAEFTYDNKDKDLKIKFKDIKGETKKVLNILDIDLSLSGPMQGDFTYTDHKTMKTPMVNGTFNGERAEFYDFVFDNISGQLEYTDALTVRNLQGTYMGGKARAELTVDYSRELFDIHGKITDIDLNKMNRAFKGKWDIDFNGKGAFNKDPIIFNYRSGAIYFFSEQSFAVKGDGKIFTNFSDFRLNTTGNIRDRGISSPYRLNFGKNASRFSGDYHLDLENIDLLIPWGNSRGTMKVDGSISSMENGEMTTEGYASFSGQVLSFPNFPHALMNFSGDVMFKNLHFTLRSLQGSIGGGAVEGSGFLNIDGNSLSGLMLELSGKNMSLYPMDRASFTLDGDIKVNYLPNRDKLLLSGQLELISGLWEREIDEGVSFNTDASLSASTSIILDMLEYDLRMFSRNNIQFNNGIGQGSGKFDLRLTGDRDFPILLGYVEIPSGFVNFSGKKFDLIRGKLTFNNKFQNDPLVNIESEAFIKNYRIRFGITGTASQIKPELQSSPPLPPRDILTLIAIGELFKRPTSTELSSQIGTGTTDLIASELTEQITKRTKKIFGNYMLRLDPNISSVTGSGMDTSRLIVGKEISKDFLIVYSTNFSTQRQEVVYLQYQLSPSLSLIGMRNEEGRLSLDIRFRKRH